MQIYWSSEGVWFRCDVIDVDGAEMGKVRYVVRGWNDLWHEWTGSNS